MKLKQLPLSSQYKTYRCRAVQRNSKSEALEDRHTRKLSALMSPLTRLKDSIFHLQQVDYRVGATHALFSHHLISKIERRGLLADCVGVAPSFQIVAEGTDTY